MSLGIVDGGSGGDSLVGREEWEGEKEGQDEHCHPAKLLSVLDFIWKGLGWQASSLMIHPLVRPIRSAAPEIALEIWPTARLPAQQKKALPVRVQTKGVCLALARFEQIRVWQPNLSPFCSRDLRFAATPLPFPTL